MRIDFPETNVVSCVFSLKNTTNGSVSQGFNEYGVVETSHKSHLKQYKYRVPDYLKGKLSPGDFVMVYCQTGYQICQVWRTNEFAAEPDKLALVTAKVNMNEYFDYLRKQKELKIMKATLIEEKKRLEAMVTWDLIASKNPEFKAMLDAYREAGGQL